MLRLNVFRNESSSTTKKGDNHYDIISAFIKSMRGSDPDAAVYYLAKMLYAGEDVKFIARRIMILASEDIGNADPQALQVAVAAAQAVERVGMPESQIILSQAVTYMACAPKSNAAVNAIFAAMDSVKHTQTTVPVHLQDAHYGGHEKLGKGIGYKYAHDYPDHYVEQQYLPSEIEGSHFYEPGDLGYEKTIKEYLQKIKGRLLNQFSHQHSINIHVIYLAQHVAHRLCCFPARCCQVSDPALSYLFQ